MTSMERIGRSSEDGCTHLRLKGHKETGKDEENEKNAGPETNISLGADF